MNKTIVSTVIILLLIITGVYVFVYSNSADQSVSDTMPVPAQSQLSDTELPQDALPLDQLPDDYLADITQDSGASVEDRLAVVAAEIHTGNSGDYIRQNFPDIDFLFTWDGPPEQGNKKIFPFFYYYSEEADTTFVICNINKTVAVCDGLQDEVIEQGVGSDHCELAAPFVDSFL